MRKSELFKLRKEEELKFSAPKGLLAKIKSIMKESEIPLVYGYKEFEPKGNWDLAYLRPLKTSDELTIRNFIEGIKEIEKNSLTKFIGTIYYNGVESMHYSNEGQTILGVTVKEGSNNPRAYSLEITLEKGKKYCAKAVTYTSNFDRLMERYIGPKKDSR